MWPEECGDDISELRVDMPVPWKDGGSRECAQDDLVRELALEPGEAAPTKPFRFEEFEF